MAKMVEVRLASAPMVHTPGVVRWAVNGYKFPKDRPALRRVLTEGYSLTRRAADDLLSGRVPYRVEGDAVVFSYEAGKYLKRAK